MNVCSKCGGLRNAETCYKKVSGLEGLSSRCKTCLAEYKKQQYLKNPERHRELQKIWVAANPEKVRAIAARWKLKNPLRRKNQAADSLKRKYRLTIEQHEKLLLDQKNLCACCKVFISKPHVDHCHKTGKIRGLLCVKCNLGLGLFKDSIDNLLAAVTYLRTAQTETSNEIEIK